MTVVPVAEMRERGSDALTMDGRIVRVRPVRPDDVAALVDLHAGLSDRSRYLRFFTAGVNVHEEVRRLVRPAGPDHLALVVEFAGNLIAVGSYERTSPTEADFALLVGDTHHGEGIGTLLLENLAAAARRDGIVELVGDVLAANTTMLKVSGDYGPGVRRSPGDDYTTLTVRVPTVPDEAALAVVGLRDRTAAHHSLRPLFAPASVAVVGAGRRPGGVGHEILISLRSSGFTGQVYAVNPRADEIAGERAYPSIVDIGQPVDLAIVAVPAGKVRDVIADCVAAGVRAAVVLTAGLAETGDSGATTQAEIVRLARRHGLRLVGPNCLGVLNTDPSVRLTATFAPSLPSAGGLAVASQSGAVGIAILDAAAEAGVGVSTFVSLGNKADVSGNDLLAYWYDDPATRAVALYLESFGNPRRFAWVARALARRKPVLAVKSGRSTGGRRAGVSHTAAAAAPDVAVDTLFAQAGVIRVDTLGELLDAARMLVDQPLPAGRRIGVVGNAGGLNVLAADATEAVELVVPELTADLQAQVRRWVPGAPGVANPVDLGAEATPEALAGAVTALAGSGEVDALVVTFVATRTNSADAALAAIGVAADRLPGIPIAVVAVGVANRPSTVGGRKVPVYDLPEPAVRAIGRAASYHAWCSEPVGERPRLSGVDSVRARAVVHRALRSGGGWQSPGVAQDLLAAYGIPVLATRGARDVDEAVEAARALGYPVAVKAAATELVHKSDVGAVRLNLADAGAVREAYAGIAEALGVHCPPVVVQPMARPGVELVAGIVHDRLFGSLVMLGLGGVHTDLLGDRTFRLLPVTDLDAARMWRSLRGAPLLTGYRGSRPSDTAAIEQLLLRLGRLAEDVPEVAELDLNPVLVGPDGAVAIDVKLRLAETEGEPDPYVRSLLPAG